MDHLAPQGLQVQQVKEVILDQQDQLAPQVLQAPLVREAPEVPQVQVEKLVPKEQKDLLAQLVPQVL